MATKKIGVLNPYIPTMGGGEKHMGYFLQFLEDYYTDVQIDLMVFNYNEIDVHSDNYVTIEDLNKKFGLHLRSTTIVKLEQDHRDTVLARYMNAQVIKKITRQYDLFINSMFLSRHAGRAKYNIYMCMFPPKRYASTCVSTLRRYAAKFLDWQFYRSYDKFICNSQFTKQWLSTYWKNCPKKNIVIYPPVFWEKEMENRYDEKNKKNIIISVGRFFVSDHSKKQLEMVRFFVSHQDVLGNYEYHLVGSVANEPKDIAYLEQVRQEASKCGNVIIHVDCPSSQLHELYAQAKIFWHATGYLTEENDHPERMEHFGITTVEAMSFGAVPVVINKGGQKETVVPGETGFLWNNEEECVSSTVRLIGDEALRKKLAQASVLRAKQFSIDEFYRQNRRVFNECGL